MDSTVRKHPIDTSTGTHFDSALPHDPDPFAPTLLHVHHFRPKHGKDPKAETQTFISLVSHQPTFDPK